jgi:hypothetical protein
MMRFRSRRRVRQGAAGETASADRRHPFTRHAPTRASFGLGGAVGSSVVLVGQAPGVVLLRQSPGHPLPDQIGRLLVEVLVEVVLASRSDAHGERVGGHAVETGDGPNYDVKSRPQVRATLWPSQDLYKPDSPWQSLR